jgi:hypothetical protein
MHDPTNDGAADDGETGFDAGATARQIGLFESANGVPHGIVAMVLAFVLAAIAYPIYRLRRRS